MLHEIPLDPQQDRLSQLYRQADYWIRDGQRAFRLQIDCPSNHARQMLHRHDARSAVIISAHNPGSERLADTANAQRQLALIAELDAAGHRYVTGFNADPAGRSDQHCPAGSNSLWPDEDTAIIFDLPQRDARTLAERFGQHAIVWIDETGLPTLRLTAAQD